MYPTFSYEPRYSRNTLRLRIATPYLHTDLDTKKFGVVEHNAQLHGPLSSLDFANHARRVPTVLGGSLLGEPKLLPAPS